MSVFTTDIYQENDRRVSPYGDLETVTGIDGLLLRIDRMLATSPGEILHRPEFGIGIHRFLNQSNTADNVAKLVNEIRRNLASDPDIERVLKVTAQRSEDEVRVDVFIKPVGFEPIGAEYSFNNG